MPICWTALPESTINALTPPPPPLPQKQHLFFIKSHLLFLTETDVSDPTDNIHFSVLSYFSMLIFFSKPGYCVYVCQSFDYSCFSLSLSLLSFKSRTYPVSLYHFAEISILRDFNVRHQLQLSSIFTYHPGELAFKFPIIPDLKFGSCKEYYMHVKGIFN